MKILKPIYGSLLIPVSVIVLFSVFTASCKIERIAILKDIPDTTTVKYVPLSPFSSPVVRTDDILNIVVQTLDVQANSILNQGNLPVNSGAVSGNSGTQSSVTGYLVGKDGMINLPYIGDVFVRGLTTEQIKNAVSVKMALYFKDPVVNVRFANFKVTVLGEVKNPSTFLVPNEKPTIIDALGLAGDLTIYGKRDNVMLIRDGDGRKEISRLNLDSSKTISSPYFYLRPNDVVYVEASASKVQSTDAYRNKNITLIAAALSFVTLLTARILFK